MAQMTAYTGRPLPAAVMIDDGGRVELLRHADSYEDLLSMRLIFNAEAQRCRDADDRRAEFIFPLWLPLRLCASALSSSMHPEKSQLIADDADRPRCRSSWGRHRDGHLPQTAIMSQNVGTRTGISPPGRCRILSLAGALTYAELGCLLPKRAANTFTCARPTQRAGLLLWVVRSSLVRRDRLRASRRFRDLFHFAVRTQRALDNPGGATVGTDTSVGTLDRRSLSRFPLSFSFRRSLCRRPFWRARAVAPHIAKVLESGHRGRRLPFRAGVGWESLRQACVRRT